jgi:hypothetical protein
MSKGSFNIGKHNTEYEVFGEMSARTDGFRSFLQIQTSFQSNITTRHTIEIISIKAKLNLNFENIFLAEVDVQCGCSINKSNNRFSVYFEFILDDLALVAIEKHRSGDVQFRIDFTMLYAERNDLQYTRSGIMPETLSIIAIQNIDRIPFWNAFTIPHSNWFNILNNLGHKNLKLIEIPISHKTLEEAYDHIISEFNHAEKYFKLQDYDKCVAHCRSTLDSLNRNLKKIRDMEESERAFKWLEAIDNATFNWINELAKATSNLASKAHHPGSSNGFTRKQAESIYTVTVGLLNYVGHLGGN